MVSRRRPSIGDVARLADVSAQTVSRVANNEPYVSDEKKGAVMAAMHELGYRPNAAARAMKRGNFKTIGVVYRSLHPVGNRNALEGIARAAAECGYAVVLIPAGAESAHAVGGVPPLAHPAIDVAIVIVSTSLGGGTNDIAPSLNVPIVVLSSAGPAQASSVSIDETLGAREAVGHLLALGHPTVHHVAGPEQSLPARNRERAWRAALLEAGRPVPGVVRGDWSPESGYEATRRLLATERPTALFVANDQMALGAYRALREAGLRIPEDVSVVGCDDIDEASAFAPPLTTVVMDWDLVGREALRVALGMIKNPAPTALTLPSTLAVRGSTASPA